MFSLVSNAIQTAVDVVSPPLPTLEEFRWHWSHIQDFYLDEKSHQSERNRSRSMILEDTHIPKHLNEIMRMLLEEDEQCFQDEQQNRINTQLTIGPCLEYVLQNRLLEFLCTLAEADEPTGTCLHVICFLTRLISDCKVNLLSHGSVLSSIHRLIAMCSSAVAGPYERSQCEFLAIITVRLQTNRDLLNCFARDGFPLCVALLSLLFSPDNQVSTKAADMLIVFVSIVDANLANVLVSETLFRERCVQLLRDVHRNVPVQLKAQEIDFSLSHCQEEASFHLQLHLQHDDQDTLHTHLPSAASASKVCKSTFSSSMRKFLCFLRWFCFYDTLVQRSKCVSLARALCDTFFQQFLCAVVAPKMFSASEVGDDTRQESLLQTTLLSHCLRNCESTMLFDTIGKFLCDDGINQKMLINRCLIFVHHHQHHHRQQQQQHQDENKNESPSLVEQDLAIQTMQLFEELLQRPSCQLVHQLFIRPLQGRTYIDISLYNINLDLNELEQSYSAIKMDDSLTTISNQDESNSNAGVIINPDFDITRFKSLHYFIDLIPNELRTCPATADCSLQTYIADAQKHFDQRLALCSGWDWPKVAYALPSSEETNRFYEGDFLNMCFVNLQNVTILPYEAILQITAIMSKIALFPHPNLNEYLLNPSLPIRQDALSLFAVLHLIVDQLQVMVARVRNLKAKLIKVRQNLLGQSHVHHQDSTIHSIDSGKEEEDEESHPNRVDSETEVTIEERKILESLIVIEEFGKELAAIAFVKNQHLI